MTRVRHRRFRHQRGLSPSERLYLMHGHVAELFPDDRPWAVVVDGVVVVDLVAAKRAWAEYRDDLLDAAADRGLIPWAAREWEGLLGPISPYEHIVVAGIRP